MRSTLAKLKNAAVVCMEGLKLAIDTLAILCWLIGLCFKELFNSTVNKTVSNKTHVKTKSAPEAPDPARAPGETNRRGSQEPPRDPGENPS